MTGNNVFSGYDMKKRIELTRRKKRIERTRYMKKHGSSWDDRKKRIQRVQYGITDPTEKVLRYEITDENRRAAKNGYDIRARVKAEDPVDLEIWHGMQQPPNLRG